MKYQYKNTNSFWNSIILGLVTFGTILLGVIYLLSDRFASRDSGGKDFKFVASYSLSESADGLVFVNGDLVVYGRTGEVGSGSLKRRRLWDSRDKVNIAYERFQWGYSHLWVDGYTIHRHGESITVPGTSGTTLGASIFGAIACERKRAVYYPAESNSSVLLPKEGIFGSLNIATPVEDSGNYIGSYYNYLTNRSTLVYQRGSKSSKVASEVGELVQAYSSSDKAVFVSEQNILVIKLDGNQSISRIRLPVAGRIVTWDTQLNDFAISDPQRGFWLWKKERSNWIYIKTPFLQSLVSMEFAETGLSILLLFEINDKAVVYTYEL